MSDYVVEWLRRETHFSGLFCAGGKAIHLPIIEIASIKIGEH